MRDLGDYEPVKQRKERFYKKYPDGRILADMVKLTEKEAHCVAYLYKSAEELERGLPIATGNAQEFKGEGGFANKTSWCENCEESAIGRALDNAGFSNGKCSREEMQKVESHSNEPVASNAKTPNSAANRASLMAELTATAEEAGWSRDDLGAAAKKFGVKKTGTGVDKLKKLIQHVKDNPKPTGGKVYDESRFKDVKPAEEEIQPAFV